jgi:hypothetical protein
LRFAGPAKAAGIVTNSATASRSRRQLRQGILLVPLIH